eukprot:TRINITY_DN9215_c0_g1_i1.p1 TRINITY_DN9215_c0_g1~~TRINITY_DN9215_c0_g1_i1.p1  ORF type:complete len:639 (+),score=172.39 TRINITY_DN9215_c0_g1_i1:40-1956(+)
MNSKEPKMKDSPGKRGKSEKKEKKKESSLHKHLSPKKMAKKELKEQKRYEEEESFQLASLSITSSGIECARSLCETPETWRMYPLEELDMKMLTAPQIDHARLMCESVPELYTLKKKMVPKYLSKTQFWNIYFTSMKHQTRSLQLQLSEPHELRNDRSYRLTRRPTLSNLIQRAESESFFKEVLEGKEMNQEEFYGEVCKGIPESLRGKIWLHLSGASKISPEQVKKGYTDSLSRVFIGDPNAESFEISTELLRNFVSPDFSYSCHHLTERGKKDANRLMWVTAKEHNGLEDNSNPYLADLICFLLHFLDQYESFFVLENRIRKDEEFVSVIRYDVVHYPVALLELLREQNEKLYRHIETLKISRKVFEGWFKRAFASYLPYQTSLRIFSCFMVKGFTVLFEVALAVLKISSTELLSMKTYEKFVQKLEDSMKEFHDATRLLQVAKEGNLKHEELVKALNEARRSTFPDFGAFLSTKPMLNESQMCDIWSFLPPSYQVQNPILLYSTAKNGTSFNTMLKKVEHKSPTLLVVKTDGDEIFGAFLTVPLEKMNEYRGSGEMFLFSISPKLRVFKWSRSNNLFVNVSNEIRIGGGSGVGLYIDNDLELGYSEACPTFQNDPLLSNRKRDFNIKTLEVYGID